MARGVPTSSHKAADVLPIFKLIDLHVPRGLDVHGVIDNFPAHKAAPIRTWLEHPSELPGTYVSLHPHRRG